MSRTLGSFNVNNTSSIVAGTNIFTPLTINSSNGVTFYKNDGSTTLGASISNAGIFNSSGFVLNGPLSNSSININSGGSITCLSAINNYGNMTTTGLTLSTNTNLTCNSYSSSNGLSCNGPITSVTSLIGYGTNCAMSGISTLNMSGSLNCTNTLTCTSYMTGTGTTCNMSGITTLNVNSSLTCTNASCGSLVVNSGNITNFSDGVSGPSISGVTNISNMTTLTTTDLSGNKIKCTSGGVVTGVNSLTMSGDLMCNNLNINSGKLTITNTGAVTGPISLTMSGDLSCSDISFNGFAFNNSGYVTANSLTCTNMVFLTGATGFQTDSLGAVSGITSLTSTGSVSCTTFASTTGFNNNDIRGAFDFPLGTINLGAGDLTCNGIGGTNNVNTSTFTISGAISGVKDLYCTNINANNIIAGTNSINATTITNCNTINVNGTLTTNKIFFTAVAPLYTLTGIQCGSANCSAGYAAITFARVFTIAPYVLCTTISDLQDYIFSIVPYNITTNGFLVAHTFVFYNNQGGAANQPFNWIAMGY